MATARKSPHGYVFRVGSGPPLGLAAGMPPAITDEQIATLSANIFSGRKIQAIKQYRAMSGLGLKESRDAVEELERSLRSSAPEKFTVTVQGKGCAGVVVAGFLCFGIIGYWLSRA